MLERNMPSLLQGYRQMNNKASRVEKLLIENYQTIQNCELHEISFFNNNSELNLFRHFFIQVLDLFCWLYWAIVTNINFALFLFVI